MEVNCRSVYVALVLGKLPYLPPPPCAPEKSREGTRDFEGKKLFKLVPWRASAHEAAAANFLLEAGAGKASILFVSKSAGELS